MYLEFFKFKKDPFDITPDPDFLFLSPSHKEASASIFYGIQARKGFVAVTGEVGVGKTTVLRSYVEGSDPEKIRIVYIFNSALTFDKLLKQICSDLGIQTAGEDSGELINVLFNYLVEEYKQDHNVVLIIDEAQNMPVETLERLRVLSNLETSQDKLIQIIVAGQPELDAKLDLPELRHLKQRIAIRSRIEALTADESVAYIHHRLMVASSFHNPVFTKKAMKHIIKQAEGVPRTINILCDNALVTAFGYLRKPVDEKIVKEVIKDFRGKQPRSGFRWKYVWVPAAVACLAGVVFVSAQVISHFETAPMSKQTVRTELSDPTHAGVKAGQSGIHATVREKKAPVEVAAKPNKKLAVHVAESSTKTVPKGKTSVAGGTPPVAGSSKAKSAPAVAGSSKAESASPVAGSSKTKSVPPVASSSKTKSVPPVASSSKTKSAPPAPTSAAGGQSQSVSPGKALPTPVTVQKGDSVSQLLFKVYGRVDAQMLKSFQRLNPQIKNINKIDVGEKVIIPRVGAAKQ